jgi:hypothetical protein
MDDGSEDEFGPNDIMMLPPGHDAWAVGDGVVRRRLGVDPVRLGCGFGGDTARLGERSSLNSRLLT